MCETKSENNGAPFPLFAASGTGSAIILLPGSQKTLSHGNLFSIIGTCPDGSPEIVNHTSPRCKGCNHLHQKDTIVWSGACSKHVTARSCLSMSPCQGPERKQDRPYCHECDESMQARLIAGIGQVWACPACGGYIGRRS